MSKEKCEIDELENGRMVPFFSGPLDSLAVCNRSVYLNRGACIKCCDIRSGAQRRYTKDPICMKVGERNYDCNSVLMGIEGLA